MNYKAVEHTIKLNKFEGGALERLMGRLIERLTDKINLLLTSFASSFALHRTTHI
jgi:hypothetical protein